MKNALKYILTSGLALAGFGAMPCLAQSAQDDLNVGLTLEMPTTLEMVFDGDIVVDQPVGDVYLRGLQSGCLSGLDTSSVEVTVNGANRPANTSGFYLKSGDIFIQYFVTFRAVGNDQSFWNFAFKHGDTTKIGILESVFDDTGDACGADITLGLEASVYETSHPNSSREPLAGDNVFRGFEPARAAIDTAGQHTFSDTFTITLSPSLTG